MSKDTYKKWIEKLQKEEKEHVEFRKQAKEVSNLYLDSEKKGKQSLNLFWSNTEILHGALYANTPLPDVRRRHTTQGEAEKTGAMIIERGISYILDNTDFDASIDSAIDSYLTTAIGVNRVKYKPKLDKDMEGNQIKVDESIELEYFPYNLFHWEPAKTWEQVDWICFDHHFTADEIKKRYKITIDATKTVAGEEKCVLHEIYHKPSRKIIVIIEGYEKVVEERDDKLSLSKFYPCAKPLFANLDLKKLLPKPDYYLADKQYEQANKISQRIASITKGIKDVGYYDSSFKELSSIPNLQDGQIQGVADLVAKLKDSSKLESVIANLPIDHKVKVVAALRDELEAKKQEIYEIYGISDIIRGASQASESATAQQIKGNWANVRIGRRQKQVATYVRNIFRIYAEIIAEQFDPQILQSMTGIEVTPEIQQLLKNDITRGYAIDVETDSTIAKDEEAERNQKLELLSRATELLTGLWPSVIAGQLPPDLVKEMLLMAVRSYKHGRTLEDAIEGMQDAQDMIGQLQQQLQQLQQQNEQLQAQGQQVQQQAGVQIQQLQQQLQSINEREETRKDAETKATVTLKNAQAQDEIADANKKNNESRIQSISPAPLA